MTVRLHALVVGAMLALGACASDGGPGARSATLSALAAIEAKNHRYRAMLAVNHDAVAEAAAVDDGERRPLSGTVIAIKDNIAVGGLPLTFGSPLFEKVIAVNDAEVVRRLRDAGAVVIGKANLDEFAGGAWGVSGLGGQVKNVFSDQHSPGGSSSGSAVAVATGMADAAIGTDTCTSILMPAAQSALVGMRPSFGMVPLQGVLPGYPRHDVVGPITHTVSEARALLEVMADAELPAAERRADELRIGLLTPKSITRRHPAVQNAFAEAIRQLARGGIQIMALEESLEAEMAAAEGTLLDVRSVDSLAAFLATLPDSPVSRRSDFVLPGVAEHISSGLKGPQSYFEDLARKEPEDAARVALHEAALASLRHRAETLMDRHRLDALMLPTVEGLPTNISATDYAAIPDDHCGLPAWSGMPAITVPAGKLAGTPFPLGLMLLGRFNADAELLSVAEAVEKIVAD